MEVINTNKENQGRLKYANSSKFKRECDIRIV